MTKQAVVVLGEPGDAAAAMAALPPRSGCLVGGGIVVRKRLQCLPPPLELPRVASWVEAMKASSPTHAKAAAAVAALSVPAVGVVDDSQAAWMRMHPSALTEFNKIVAGAAMGKKLVMFLDYDGTLSPIVDDPEAAFMTEKMRHAVKNVARHFPTAIVSGRCRDKVFQFVKLSEIYYAGSHGMDIRAPAKRSKHAKSKSKGVLFQPAREFLPMIEEVYLALTEKTQSIGGTRVENNKFCLSVHFRCVDPNSWDRLAELVMSVIRQYPKLRITQGRMVLEIRPAIKWDKGKALEFLLDSLGFTDCDDVLPIYIGDDRTDEDAFKVLRQRNHGIGILVSKFPKDTNAVFTLRDPTEVMEFLLRLVQWSRLWKATGEL